MKQKIINLSVFCVNINTKISELQCLGNSGFKKNLFLCEKVSKSSQNVKQKSLKDLVKTASILLPDGFSHFLPRKFLFRSNKFIQIWQNFNIWHCNQEHPSKVTQNQDEIKKYGEMVPNIIFSKLVRYKTTFMLSLVIKHNFNWSQNSFFSGFLEVQILLPVNFRFFQMFFTFKCLF